MEAMSGRERYLALLRGEPADRPAAAAVVSLATAESCGHLGFSFEETHLNADKMAALAAYAHTGLGFDSVMPYFSVVQEAAALGATVDWGSVYMMPYVRGRLFDDPGAFKLPPDFLGRTPVRTILDSLRLLKKRVGDAAVICGKAMGPWTLALRLYGLEELLIATIDDPPLVNELMVMLSDVSRIFIEAQLLSGADVVTLADHTTSNLVSPRTYTNFVQPRHAEMNRMYPGKLILHCCGDTMDRVGHFKDGGFNWFHFESANPAAEAIPNAAPMRLIGNINIPDTLLTGTREDIEAAVRNCVGDGLTMVSPECAVPLQVSDASLKCIADTCRKLKFK